MMEQLPLKLPNEGEVKIIRKTKVRCCCDECGEYATKKHTFLLDNARSNPASSAYRHDDCSWCSDTEAFACDDCAEKMRRNPPDGYGWCGTFSVTPEKLQFAHMFLKWKEEDITPEYSNKNTHKIQLAMLVERVKDANRVKLAEDKEGFLNPDYFPAEIQSLFKEDN